MWLDEIEIPEGSIDWPGTGYGVVGAVQSGDLRGNASENTTTFFRKYLGTFNQAASNMLGSAFLEVNSSHMGKGIATLLFAMISLKTKLKSGHRALRNHTRRW